MAFSSLEFCEGLLLHLWSTSMLFTRGKNKARSKYQVIPVCRLLEDETLAVVVVRWGETGRKSVCSPFHDEHGWAS